MTGVQTCALPICGAVEEYNDSDLACIIQKMKELHIKVQNETLTNQIKQTTDEKLKMKKLKEKYNNKKQTMIRRRK